MADPSNSGNQYDWDQWFDETIVSQDDTDAGYRGDPLPNDYVLSQWAAADVSTLIDGNQSTLVQEDLLRLLFPEDTFVPSSSITRLDMPPSESTGSQARDSHPPHIRSDVLDDFPPPPSIVRTSTQPRDSYLPHIRDNYLTNPVMGSSRPARRGERQWGEDFDRIFQLPGTQRSLRKSKQMKVPNEPLPSTPAPSTLAPPASVSASAPPVPTPTASDTAPTTPATCAIPQDILKALKTAAKEDLRRYALTQQPIQCEVVSAYSCDVAKRLLNDHTPSPEIWLKENPNTFTKVLQNTYDEITQAFKNTARICILDAYDLPVETNNGNSLHDIWRPILTHLLNGWTFADAPVIFNGQYFPSEFNHRAIKTIIVRSLWCPPGKLSKSLPTLEMSTVDTLLAFAATMARWALMNLQLRRDLEFDANFNHRVFTQAMERIKVIWSEGGVQLQCLEVLTTDILGQAQQLNTHYLATVI